MTSRQPWPGMPGFAMRGPGGGIGPWWSNVPADLLGWYGLGGLRSRGGSYSAQFQTTGTPTDEEIEEMIYDRLDEDRFVPYDADIDVESVTGTVTLRGEVPNKHVKHAAGDDAWWVPGVVDVRNELVVTGRRRARTAPREGETPGQHQ